MYYNNKIRYEVVSSPLMPEELRSNKTQTGFSRLLSEAVLSVTAVAYRNLKPRQSEVRSQRLGQVARKLGKEGKPLIFKCILNHAGNLEYSSS